LFISMRIAASCGHPRQERSVPRGARISRRLISTSSSDDSGRPGLNGRAASLLRPGGAARFGQMGGDGSSRRYRVMIAEDEPEVRSALADLMTAQAGLDVIGAAEDTDTAISIAEEHQPDVALVEVKMRGGGAPRAIREIADRSPATKVIVLSAFEDRFTVVEMIRAGAAGYLVKGTPPEEIVRAVERVLRGQTSLSAEVAGGVVEELTTHLQREQERSEAEREQIERIEGILRGNGLSIVFQPIVGLETGTIIGAEALARFAGSPPLPPDRWFAEAGSVGLGTDLELHAIELAVRDAPRLPEDAYLSLNCSHWTLLSGKFLRALGTFPAGRVVVEITEHAEIENYDALDGALDLLRAHAVRLAIDDAGAGFASLRHTLRLAPDIVKLDISLTRAIDHDRGRRALASALISFADEMGMSIVAEGVETKEELATLRGLGVQHAQGFLLGYPVPVNELVSSTRIPPS
jgi:EAL domain-containing protein (putative c-di-GMP-specific phosphodiesterase class I)/CheY-like chemotaxis protein